MNPKIRSIVESLICNHKFLQTNDRHRAFLKKIADLSDDDGNIPASKFMPDLVGFSYSHYQSYQKLLKNRGCWPFRSNQINRDFNPPDHHPVIRRDMARLEAARKAKLAKCGENINGDDIERYL